MSERAVTKRTTGAAKVASARRRRASKTQPSDDLGHLLPVLARAAADKVRMPKTPLSRSQALAEAPWDGSFPPAWEAAFREAYADRLEDLGVALPAKRSGASGPSQSDYDRVARGIGRLTLRITEAALEKLEREARRVGCSRAKLIESMIAGLK